MSPEERGYVPKVSFEVTKEALERFDNVIPWGMKSKIMALLLDDLLDLIEKEGDIVLTALVKRVINVQHVMRGLQGLEGGEKSGTS